MQYLNGTFSTSQWAIWKIDESEEELLQMLDGDYIDILNHKSARRRIEMLAVRVLLKEMLHQEVAIYYLQSGKPYLDNGVHISISHTSGYVAIILNSSVEVALDVERFSEKLHKVRDRFVLDTDSIDATLELKQLTLYWGAKEAIYKYIDDPAIDLLNEVVLDEFSPLSNIGKFGITYMQKAPNKFEAFYVCTEYFALVIIQKNPPK